MANISIIAKMESTEKSFENRYVYCFYNVITAIRFLGKACFNTAEILETISKYLRAWKVDTFNPDDWEIIIDALQKYAAGGDEIDITDLI